MSNRRWLSTDRRAFGCRWFPLYIATTTSLTQKQTSSVIRVDSIETVWQNFRRNFDYLQMSVFACKVLDPQLFNLIYFLILFFVLLLVFMSDAHVFYTFYGPKWKWMKEWDQFIKWYWLGLRVALDVSNCQIIKDRIKSHWSPSVRLDFFVILQYQLNAVLMLFVGIKYSVSDLLCDVNNSVRAAK